MTPAATKPEASLAPAFVDRWRWLWLAALLALWVPIFHLLSPQWSFYENYRFGWAIPFLASYLGWKRWCDRPESDDPAPGTWLIATTLLLASLLFPFRVLQEANPLWRLASYGLVSLGCFLSLLIFYSLGGLKWVRHFAFPTGFVLVAVPWPSPVETSASAFFGYLNTCVASETAGWLGIPAVARGNVIEVTTGYVGIDEACSGIRSLQATLMIQLLFGELYRFQTRTRLFLLGLGFLLAITLNWVRTAVLVLVVASHSPAALERWHDRTGVLILLACFTGCWAVARWARSSGLPQQNAGKTDRSHQFVRPLLPLANVVFAGSFLSVIGSTLWFRLHENGAVHEVALALSPAKWNSNVRQYPIAQDVKDQLLFDAGQSVGWRESDGTRWHVFHFRWDPARSFADRVRVHFAKSHRPEICLPASGRKLERELEVTRIRIGGIEFPFRTYQFTDGKETLYAFYCAREDGATPGKAANMRETHFRRFQAAWEGRRGLGQRVIEVVIFGARSFQQARDAFEAKVPSLFSINASAGG